MFITRYGLRITAVAFVALVALWAGQGSRAQSSVTSTILEDAITTTDQQTIKVASASGIAVGDLAVVDREAMAIVAIDGTNLTVRRGQSGTAAATHLDESTVYVDPPNAFHRRMPSGSCTATSERYAPRIVLPDVRIFDCINSRWAERLSPELSANANTVTGRLLVREDFDVGYYVFNHDGTNGPILQVATDGVVNVVVGSPIGVITMREEQAKTADSWLVADGKLDIKADNTTDNEGVEIVFGAWGDITTEGLIVARTSGLCFTANLTITDISGTDQFGIGWRQNEAFEGANNYVAYTDWSYVGINATDGSVVAQHEVNGGGTLTDDSGVNMADAETFTLKSCVKADGTHQGYLNGKAITVANGVGAHTADIQMIPFLTFLAAGTDGPNPLVNWVQLERVP